MKKMFFMGCDGGSTKYAYAVCDQTGHVLVQHTEPGLNYMRGTAQSFGMSIKRHLAEVLTKADIEEEQISYAAYGLSGYGEGRTVSEDMFRIISSALGHDRLVVCNDSVIGWSGALASRPGISVGSGTGSIAYGEDAHGMSARAGGWSLDYGDEGSSCWVAKRAINAFCRQADGRMPRTLLYDWFVQRFRLENPLYFIQAIHDYVNGNSARCASLQREILPLYEAGDPCIREIYRQAAAELAQLVAALQRELSFEGETMQVSYSGGLFKGGSCILDPFSNEIEALGGELVMPRFGPLTGALGIAARNCLGGGELNRMMDRAGSEIA